MDQVKQNVPNTTSKAKHANILYVKQSMPIFYQTKQHDKNKIKEINFTFFSDLFTIFL